MSYTKLYGSSYENYCRVCLTNTHPTLGSTECEAEAFHHVRHELNATYRKIKSRPTLSRGLFALIGESGWADSQGMLTSFIK